MLKKLYIYDKTSFHDRMAAAGRFDFNDTDVVTLPVGSMVDVIDALDELVAKGEVCDRMLFQTHGNSGVVFFGEEHVFPTDWMKNFSNRKYDKLFPVYARVYFDGCNVAEGGVGVHFLRTLGSIFLKGMGGELFGWTAGGLALPGWLPFIGGHTVHFSGKLVRVRFDHENPDGIVVPEPLEPPPVPPYAGWSPQHRH